MSSKISSLTPISLEIDARVASIRAQCPDWPCAKGCDRCCRQLADWPQLTLAEWQLLKEGLATLSTEKQQEIRQAVAAQGPVPVRPVTCPLLDQTSGACPVYLQRPMACRSYGYYMQRGIGLFCHDIEERTAAQVWPDVIWGNQDAIERQLAALGKRQSLAQWFADEGL